MMMGSWEANVSHTTPLGVAHQFRSSDHYGPLPNEWFNRDDWSPVYYNKADSAGLGFDRSATGSNFVAQYFAPLQERYGSIDTTPENLLMWFHHVPWDRTMSSGRPFWDELVYRYQMGVQYVTWMRETWETLAPYVGARRFAEVKAKLALHETDAASWRDASVNYWREFNGKPNPVDSGPLSLAVTVGGVERKGFDLSANSYTIPVKAGASRTLTGLRTFDPAAKAELVSQTDEQAVVKVSKTDFFGPLVKNYVFNLVPDTTLTSLRVNRTPLKAFKPDVLSYNALVEGGVEQVPLVEATASDPAATVAVEPAATRTGTARVTVTNGAASSVYVVNLDTALRGSDEFDGPAGPQWEVVRPDDARRQVSGGALRITSQAGDLQGNTNTARNLVLQDVNGDWTAETKVVFSRPLAQNNEQGGLLAYAGDQNYVKVGWEMSSSTQAINKLRVVMLREQNGTATTIQVTGSDAQQIVKADGAIWLRLAKTGGTYKAYYSSDGRVWRYFGTTTLNVEPTDAGLFAFNRAGTSTDLEAAFDFFRIGSTGDVVPSLIADGTGSVGGTVPATLGLTLGAPATFGAFIPGVAREYTAATTATVTSTAGDATLTADTGRLTNGAFSLAQPLGVAFSKSAWTGPASNDAVDVAFKQAIGANEPLRTGSYSRTVTFTLATTNP
jgi:alpha-glucuronidase